MNFEEWQRSQGADYLGCRIRVGSVWKDGEPVLIFHVPLGASKEQSTRTGMVAVDELVANRSGGPKQ